MRARRRPPAPRPSRHLPPHHPHRRHGLSPQALGPTAGHPGRLVLRKLGPVEAVYQVTSPKGRAARCTCPDHERSGWTCKHLGALLALGLIPAPKPASARNKRLHAKNARLAIAEAKALPKEARQHLAEIAPPAPAPSLPEGWQPGGDYHRSFADGFREAVGAHVARIGRGGYEICDGCGINFDPYTSGHPNLCHGFARDGVS